jgi:hypothetical protein
VFVVTDLFFGTEGGGEGEEEEETFGHERGLEVGCPLGLARTKVQVPYF